MAWFVRYERDLRRPHREYAFDEIFGRISLDIELRGEAAGQYGEVVEANVTLVRAGVNRDAVGAEALDIEGDVEQVGNICTAGVPQERNFVDVYTESGHLGGGAVEWRK